MRGGLDAHEVVVAHRLQAFQIIAEVVAEIDGVPALETRNRYLALAHQFWMRSARSRSSSSRRMPRNTGSRPSSIARCQLDRSRGSG
jgi:hypothetical protein